MDVSALIGARIEEINRSLAQRFAQIPTPEKKFAELLGQRLAPEDEGAIYRTATPANLYPAQSAQSAQSAQPAQAESAQAEPTPLLDSAQDLSALPSASTASTLSAAMEQKKAQYDPLVQQAAIQYDLPAELIHAVIRAESSYNPASVSSAGAQGLMQLMPDTAKGLGVTNSFDPAQNIDGGSNYLRQMLDQFGGDLRVALAAYNCGPYRVQSLGIASSADAEAYGQLSQGVRTYVERVLDYASVG